jgi:hypothetical protein
LTSLGDEVIEYAGEALDEIKTIITPEYVVVVFADRVEPADAACTARWLRRVAYQAADVGGELVVAANLAEPALVFGGHDFNSS